MTKTEEFIKDCTRNCSNELGAFQDRTGTHIVSYHEWLTPEQALRAVEIAREELVDEITKNIDVIGMKHDYFFNCRKNGYGFEMARCSADGYKQGVIDTLKAMKGEQL